MNEAIYTSCFIRHVANHQPRISPAVELGFELRMKKLR